MSVDEAAEALRAHRPVIVVDRDDPASQGLIAWWAGGISGADVESMEAMSRRPSALVAGEELLAGGPYDDAPLSRGDADDEAGPLPASAGERAAFMGALATRMARAGPVPAGLRLERAAQRGVLDRPSRTEAAVDLARLAGLAPAVAVSSVRTARGRAAHLRGILALARRHGLAVVSVADIIARRQSGPVRLERVGEAALPTAFGRFQAVAYRERVSGETHLALLKGEVGGAEPTLVRIHSECLTGDVFGSRRCDCGEQLHAALQQIERRGQGLLLYLRQEGRGIGLAAKIQAYALQEQGLDTVQANLVLGYPPDLRDYGIAAQILADLGVRRIALMTNNPVKVEALSELGIEVAERLALEVGTNPANTRYMATKREKMGHILHEP